MEKIAEEVRKYLKNKPYALEALRKGIVNLSKLSRIICKETGISNTNATKAALRRYAIELGSREKKEERNILSLLHKSRVSLTDGVSVAISRSKINTKSMVEIGSDGLYIYLFKEEPPRALLKKADMLKQYSDASAVIIRSGEDIESTSGVVAYLASLLAQQKINVKEFISFYTDTILIVDKSDALKIYSLLSSLG